MKPLGAMIVSLAVLSAGVVMARLVGSGVGHAIGLLLSGTGLFLFAAAIRARADRRGQQPIDS